MTLKDGKLYGRGSTDDKGPIVAWINALEVLQNNKIPIPVNIKVSRCQKTICLAGIFKFAVALSDTSSK